MSFSTQTIYSIDFFTYEAQQEEECDDDFRCELFYYFYIYFQIYEVFNEF